MNTPDLPTTSAHSGKLNRYPTIGLFVIDVAAERDMQVWRGAVDAIRQRDANLLCLTVGRMWGEWHTFYEMRHVLLDLIGPKNMDGLITFQWWDSCRAFERFYERYRPLPVVNATRHYPDYPGIQWNQKQAVYDLVSHLIEAHDYRRIAYICAFGRFESSETRYQAYIQALEDHGLAVNPDLVVPFDYVYHSEVDEKLPVRGESGIHYLLDEKGLRPGKDLDAIVAFNDSNALSAIEALRQRGIRVPDDIAVVGFDNVPKGRSIVPSLTTVALPWYEIGQRSANMVLDTLSGHTGPTHVTLPLQLVIRQSCGCLEPIVIRAGIMAAAKDIESQDGYAMLLSKRIDILDKIMQTANSVEAHVERDLLEQLLTDFIDTLQARELSSSCQEISQLPTSFSPMLSGILRQVIMDGEPVEVWQDILSTLRGEVLAYVSAQPIIAQVECLCQQARVLIGEMILLSYRCRDLRTQQQAQKLRDIQERLVTTFDLKGLMEMIAKMVPSLGIPGMYLSVYESPAGWSEYATLLLVYNERGYQEFTTENRRFASRSLIPEGLLSQEKPYSMVVEPLYFQDRHLGFVLFETGSQEGSLYNVLRGQISAALQGALLVRQVRERTIELEEARRFADEANQAKSEFLANMSHELRTPLNSVLGYAQILQQDRSLVAKQKEKVSIIYNSGEHLLHMINNVLDLSKIEARKLEIVPNAFHLLDCLQSLASMIRIRAQEKGLVFASVFDPTLPVVVGGDETRLRQVLLNLLSNAVKFTDRGSVTLSISNVGVEIVAEKGTGQSKVCILKFEVQDTGSGISADQVKRIFEAFHQVKEHRAQGTGLGLSISRQLVQLMGGDIRVDSAPGRGSRFWFTIGLPVINKAIAASKPSPVLQRIVGYRGERLTVLIADDRESNRSILKDLLTPLGFDILEAKDGCEAVEIATTRQPDAILMDLKMPKMDGYEATRSIRRFETERLRDSDNAHQPHIPIIALTANVFEDSRRQSIDAGCDGFLAKPLQIETLLTHLHRYLAIDWIYEEPSDVGAEPGTAEETATLIPPPHEILMDLFSLLELGQLDTLQKQAHCIAQSDPTLAPFMKKLADLAGDFQLEDLWQMRNFYAKEQS